MKETEFLILETKEIIHFKDLNKYFPFVTIQGRKIHLELCEFIANNFYSYTTNSEEWKVLVNFLSQRSLKIKRLTAIIIFSKKHKIKEVNSNYISDIFSVFFDYKIKFSNQTNYKNSFINKSQFYSSIIKILPYRLFYLFKKKSFSKNTVIRSWTDNVESLYKNEYNTSQIFIYPFYMNIKRGLKYIIHCFKTYDNVSLMGIQYSFKDLYQIIKNKGIDRDCKMIEYEINALRKHRKDIEVFDKVLTSDEFILASPILYNEMINNKFIENKTHGIGFFNPYICYSKINCFNDVQKGYYLLRNDAINITSLNHKITKNKYKKGNNNTVVIIDQGNTAKYELLYESNLQHKLYSLLSMSKLKIHIKLHPNITKNEKKKLLKKYSSFSEITNITSLNNYNILFINLYSTAYYDYNKYGKFIFIKDDFFDPSIFFGDSINVVDINTLQKTLDLFLNQQFTN